MKKKNDQATNPSAVLSAAVAAANSRQLQPPPALGDELCPAGRQRGDSALATQLTIAKSPIGRRVLVIGLPHSGTTSMHSMLLQLGCCYNTHNINAASPNISWTWDVYPISYRPRTGGDWCKIMPKTCEAVLNKELQHFQCVQDNPWASHWRSITAAYPQAYVVLTRAQARCQPCALVREAFGRGARHISQEQALLRDLPAVW
eukprot:CAMPEP_0119349984 /NCGR_PEP_ID=MMETSP1333-20130426/109828_1 /TAXON_ID=418940 /ORGANISM="Scyphosphaera apsteinii, Strain RCC1455" /LENGTH=202 /DNA_ID=CAMNT_0007362591 /DNA_START=32 /DNA_END=638 /DNA_ORIENTATION=-